MQWFKKTKRWDFTVLNINEGNFVNILPSCSVSMSIAIGWWNILKNKNGLQEVTSSVMNLRKTLEMMLAIAKVQNKEKAFMEKVKTTLHLPTLLQLSTGQVYQ